MNLSTQEKLKRRTKSKYVCSLETKHLRIWMLFKMYVKLSPCNIVCHYGKQCDYIMCVREQSCRYVVCVSGYVEQSITTINNIITMKCLIDKLTIYFLLELLSWKLKILTKIK